MDAKPRKSITKELDVCHDCAEYGGQFCDECLQEIKNMKKKEELLAFDTPVLERMYAQKKER